MKRFLWLVALVVSLVLFVFSMEKFFGTFQLAYVITVSVLLHEIGHILALQWYGIKANLVFVPFLGAATLPSGSDFDKLSWFQIAVVVLAGPFASTLLVVAGMFIAVTGNPSFGISLASLNAALVIFNLVPYLQLDGQKFSKSLFESLDEKGDRAAARLIGMATALVAFFAILWLGRINFLAFLIIWGMNRASNKDDPEGYRSSRAMTATQANNMLGIYMVMLLFCLAISFILPAWNAVN